MNPPILVIYTTRGDLGAYLQYPYLFNLKGEWIGWVNANRQVYSVSGHYVGWISDEPRILRKHSSTYYKPLDTIPPAPGPFRPPANSPLPSLMPELSYGVYDVLEETPEFLPAYDFGDLKKELD